MSSGMKRSFNRSVLGKSFSSGRALLLTVRFPAREKCPCFNLGQSAIFRVLSRQLDCSAEEREGKGPLATTIIYQNSDNSHWGKWKAAISTKLDLQLHFSTKYRGCTSYQQLGRYKGWGKKASICLSKYNVITFLLSIWVGSWNWENFTRTFRNCFCSSFSSSLLPALQLYFLSFSYSSFITVLLLLVKSSLFCLVRCFSSNKIIGKKVEQKIFQVFQQIINSSRLIVK